MLKYALALILFFFSIHEIEANQPLRPYAGIIERELEKEYQQPLCDPFKKVPTIQMDIPKECLELPEGQKILIQEIQFKGNSLFCSHELYEWVRGSFGKELSLKDIYLLCGDIDQHYAERGYFLARAYPPAQTIENGILTIEVLEGRLGQIKVCGNQYYSTEFIRSYFRPLQNLPLCYDQFLRALLLLNDYCDIYATAIFEKGEEFGAADVIIQVADCRPIHLYVNGNNYGRDLTTNVRGGGRLDVGNLIMDGDLFSVAEVVGIPVNALYFTDVTYTLPINRRGTFLKAGYLFSKFHIEEFKSLHLKGRSDIATLKINHALFRGRFLDIDLFSYFDYKQIQNYALGHQTSFDKLRVLTFGASAERFNPCQGRDCLVLRTGIAIPNIFGGLKSVDPECSRKGAGGRFIRFNLDYDRLQFLKWDCFCYFHASIQYSPNPLPLPEEIYIGGVDTVRGFPIAVALGDSGYYFNLEARSPPPPFIGEKPFFNTKIRWKEILQLAVFVDHGGVGRHGTGGRYGSKNVFLTGAGVGIRICGPYCSSLSVDVGFPLNHHNLTNGVAFTYIKLTGQPF